MNDEYKTLLHNACYRHALRAIANQFTEILPDSIFIRKEEDATIIRLRFGDLQVQHMISFIEMRSLGSIHWNAFSEYVGAHIESMFAEINKKLENSVS